MTNPTVVHGDLAHSIALAARKDGLSRFPGLISVASQLACDLWFKIKVSISLGALLETARKEEFWWISIEIDMVPIERDEFADAKPGVSEQRDDRLVTRLEVVREGVGKAGVADGFDLFGGDPGGGLIPSLSA